MYKVSQTVLHGGRIYHALRGHFRSQPQAEVVLVRENSLQLCSDDMELVGPIQPLFTMIDDVHHLRNADCIGLEHIPEVPAAY